MNASTLLVAVPLLLAAHPQEDPIPPSAKKLGILVYPGVQVIDFTGPYEVLTGATSKGKRLFDVMTVGLSADVFRAGSLEKGIRMLPDVTMKDCPKLDILLIPGGETGSVEDNPDAMTWVGKAVAEAECVMSVCNGAFVLAKGGHLKNQAATTFYYFIDDLAEAVENSGTTDQWTKRWTFGSSMGREKILEVVEGKMAAVWKKGSERDGARTWTFEDDKGNPWAATLSLESTGENAWSMTLRIERGKR